MVQTCQSPNSAEVFLQPFLLFIVLTALFDRMQFQTTSKCQPATGQHLGHNVWTHSGTLLMDTELFYSKQNFVHDTLLTIICGFGIWQSRDVHLIV